MFLKLKSAIFLFLLNFLYFFLPIPAFYFFFTGCNLTKFLLILLLIYQYTICKENHFFRKIVAWGAPIKFFQDYNMIFDNPETPYESNSKVLLCYHPHGVMAYGVTLLTYQFRYLYDFVRLGSRIALNIPWGGIILKLGGIQGINPENLNILMKQGKKILMVPGGYEEATITNNNEDRVFVKNRKGFIKYALRYGYTVHPCYGFNENKTYYYFTFVKLGLLLNKFKIPAVMFISKFLNILPNNDVSIYFVIGKGITFPVNENPTKEEVEEYHRMYVESLKGLFDKYKRKFGISGELQIY